MSDQLRAITLSVEESERGLFHWSLVERQSESPFEERIAVADEPYDSFEKAARAGLIRWINLAGDDARRGPRLQRSLPLEPQALQDEASTV